MPGPGADSFGDEERTEVLEVLTSGHLSRFGDLADPRFRHKVYDLELAFARHCGAPYALATNSGTSALLLSLLALGVGEGDEVLVPGFTYVATYAAIIHAGATPVLVEIDNSLTIDPADVERKITPRSKLVIAVHMLGAPCDMSAITAVTQRHGLYLLEDACQAVGASYRGQRVGSFGDLGAFSFNRYKVISSGEGGILTTRSEALHKRAFAFHDQGHVPHLSSKRRPAAGVLGLNLKMNELTGAVALAQLRKVDLMLARLRSNKRWMLDSIPVVDGMALRHMHDGDGECATFLTVIFDDPQRAASVATSLGATTLSESAWHNYRFMGHRVQHRTERDCKRGGSGTMLWSKIARYADPGALPVTDDLLLRAVSISIGVVDKGLGASYGININSDDNAMQAAVAGFVSVVRASSG